MSYFEEGNEQHLNKNKRFSKEKQCQRQNIFISHLSLKKKNSFKYVDSK